MCTVVTILLNSLSDNTDVNSDKGGWKVPVDLQKKKLAYTKDQIYSPAESHFAKNFINQLSNDDYLMLHQEYLALKLYLTETTDIDSINVDFPVDEIGDIEYHGLMVVYKDVFPFGLVFQVNISGQDYAVFDQYCVKRGCSCSEPVLSFVLMKNNKPTRKEFIVCSVNYKNRLWKIRDSAAKNANENTLAAVRKAVVGKYPEIYSVLNKRHNQLRRIYANFIRRYEKSRQQIAAVKIGRNEPCPCGSGKKYKYCCLTKK
jgi:hypothetical protein